MQSEKIDKKEKKKKGYTNAHLWLLKHQTQLSKNIYHLPLTVFRFPSKAAALPVFADGETIPLESLLVGGGGIKLLH